MEIDCNIDVGELDNAAITHVLLIRFEITDVVSSATCGVHSTCTDQTCNTVPVKQPYKTSSCLPYREFHILTMSKDHLSQISNSEVDVEDFFCGNPQVSTEPSGSKTVHGVMHLYKQPMPEARSRIICMTAVPACLTLKDLTSFLSHFTKCIQELKIIRNLTPNQYMVLLYFDQASSADAFYNANNQCKYNLLEPHVCSLSYVARVDTVRATDGSCFPIEGAIELPTCPVCLERLDEPLRGVVTILCNHSFHIKCLDDWENSAGTCPVCRMLQVPQPTDGNSCFECDKEEDLWICLLCGYVGCGRYSEGHARAHFESTSHTFALEVGKNVVWDYVADSYVHRLVQNKGDGKLVQVSGDLELDNCDEKMDAITMEFTYLLTSQLESQRLYFEEQLKKQERAFFDSLEASEAHLRDNQMLMKQLSDLKSEKQQLEKKLNAIQNKIQKLQSELEEERGFNVSLRQNQKDWQEKLSETQTKYSAELKKKDSQIADLEDQLKDLLFHVDATAKLSQEMSSQELQNSHILLGEATGVSQTDNNKSKRRSSKSKR